MSNKGLMNGLVGLLKRESRSVAISSVASSVDKTGRFVTARVAFSGFGIGNHLRG
jgi:hypothetical protein